VASDPIDTDAIRSMIGDRSDNLYDAEIQRYALCDEVDRLRAEVAVLEQVCRDQRERVPAKTRDPESGIYIGGPSCEHPNVAYDGDRCRWCGATGDDL
jgi:hypothetical protein